MELIEIILYLVIGFGAAIIGSLMGIGGGFLMIPILIFMGKELDAPVISIFVITFTALSASFKYARIKSINYRIGLIFAPFTVGGAFLGAYLLHILTNDLIFKIAFSCLIIYAGIYLILKKDASLSQISEESGTHQRSYYWIVFWGFLMGLSSSFLGIGGGLIAVPVLSLFFMLEMHVAIATSLFIMIFTASASSLQHYIQGDLSLPVLIVALIVTVGAVVGAQIGSAIQTHLKGKQLQLIFGIFIMGIALPLLWLGP